MIHAAIVNQNTSAFTELALRSLLATDDLAGVNLQVTVLDNRSDDEPHLTTLRAYLAEHGFALEQTGFDTSISPPKHPAALRDFVLATPAATHYLFLDCDIWFTDPATVSTMMRELTAAGPDVFACQARISGHYAGRVIEGRDGVPAAGDELTWETQLDGKALPTTLARRCSPVCTLVKNTPTFRRVAETLGFLPAMVLDVRPPAQSIATYHDTFALLTKVMATHGQRFIVSSRTIRHFTNVVWAPQWRECRDRECQEMLAQLRAAAPSRAPVFTCPGAILE